MLKISSFVLVGAAVSACAQQASSVRAPATPAAPAAGVCNAAGAQFALGQSLTAQVQTEAQTRSGAKIVRVLRPGQMVTMEFNEQRLNLEVDGTGRVIQVRCG